MLSRKKKTGIAKETLDEWLTLFPNQNCPYKTVEKGKYILELPRAENKFFKVVISIFAKSDTMKIKLDETGSFIWDHCTGKKHIRQIVKLLENRFGDVVKPAEERTVLFFQRMYRYNLIKFYKAESAGD